MRGAWLLFGLFVVACEEARPQPGQSLPLVPSSAPLMADAPTSSPVTGKPDTASVRAVLRQALPSLEGCFATQAQWVVTLRFVLSSRGEASQVRLAGDAATPAEEACVGRVLTGLSFPGFAGEPVRVSYPLALGLALEPAVAGEASFPLPDREHRAPSTAPSTAPTSSPGKSVADQLLEAERRLALGESAAAEAALSPLLSLPSPPAEALFLMGVLAEERGQLTEMCGYYRRYLAQAPDAPAAPSLARQVARDCENAPRALPSPTPP